MGRAENVNLFSRYENDEDRFTNGLISILSLSPPAFVKSFFYDLAGFAIPSPARTFKVQVQDECGRPDAELSGRGWCVRFETKIVSGALGEVLDRKNQIHRHLRDLRNCPGRLKRLVLLTPDDTASSYIRCIRAEHKAYVLHVAWRRVCDYLSECATSVANKVLAKLVRQYLDQIRDCIFELDFVGIIQKVAFNARTGVDPDTILSEMRNGEWTQWNTPQKYDKLDGKGRKLMFYDRTREAIVAEVEISRVKHTRREKHFPWANYFAPGTLMVYSRPISVDRILGVPGYENFKRSWSGHWNVTHEQYRKLRAASRG